MVHPNIPCKNIIISTKKKIKRTIIKLHINDDGKKIQNIDHDNSKSFRIFSYIIYQYFIFISLYSTSVYGDGINVSFIPFSYFPFVPFVYFYIFFIKKTGQI